MSGFIIIGSLILQLESELPDTETIRNIELKIPLRVYTSEGLLISEFGDERRNPVDIDDVPKQLINAILSSEDDAFFTHNGVDFKGLVRAALRNSASRGSRKEGASTITMQVARNFFLSPEQTYTRKITEILVAIKLEQTLTKNEILSLYLNKIYLGHRAYGFGAAADVYYGKPLQQLTTAELAMLAGLPKAPSSYNPISNPKRALSRRNYVLGRLNELGFLTEQELEASLSNKVTAHKQSQKTEVSAPHIAEMVRAKLVKQYGSDVYWQGLNVVTTIRAKEQLAAEKALRKGLQAYDKRHGFRGAIAHIDINTITIDAEQPQKTYRSLLKPYPSSQEQVPALITTTDTTSAIAQTQNNGPVTLTLKGASWAKRHRTQNRVSDRPTSMDKLLKVGDVIYIQPVITSIQSEDQSEPQWQLSQLPDVSGSIISIAPQTGELISLVGGYDFFINKYNRAVQSIRQPGSNIKPFIYSAAIDKGFTPATLISGAPIVIRDATHGTVWRPENYSGKFFGPTRMRTALAKSMNLVSIRLLRSIGIPYAREYTARFGINMDRFSPTLTMALGSGGATPLEILSAYSIFANGGYKIQPSFIKTITDRNGEVIFQSPTPVFCDECYQEYLPANDSSFKQENEASQPGEINVNAQEGIANINNEPTEEDLQPLTYSAPRVMSHANNFLTVSMLKDVVQRGTARKALALNRADLAGKTGTTNDYVDAWFSGFNSQVATTVWVGFDNPISMGRGEAGGVAALPIWVDYMNTALNDIPEDSTVLPQYIQKGLINRTTGKQTNELDPSAITEYFLIPELAPENVASNAESTLLNAALEEELESELELEQDALLDPEGMGVDLTTSTEEAVESSDEGPIERIIEDTGDTDGLF